MKLKFPLIIAASVAVSTLSGCANYPIYDFSNTTNQQLPADSDWVVKSKVDVFSGEVSHYAVTESKSGGEWFGAHCDYNGELTFYGNTSETITSKFRASSLLAVSSGYAFWKVDGNEEISTFLSGTGSSFELDKHWVDRLSYQIMNGKRVAIKSFNNQLSEKEHVYVFSLKGANEAIGNVATYCNKRK